MLRGAYLNKKFMTKIVLQQENLNNFILKADKLPKNWLGLAGDLKWQNNFLQGEPQIILAPQIDDLVQQGKMMFLYKVNKEDGRIIFGLSFKGEEIVQIKSNDLFKINFLGKIEEFERFDNTVFSVMEQGRKDIDVNWDYKGVQKVQVVSKKTIGGEEVGEVTLVENMMRNEEDWSDLTFEIVQDTNDFSYLNLLSAVKPGYFWLIFIVILISVLIKLKIRQNKLKLE